MTTLEKLLFWKAAGGGETEQTATGNPAVFDTDVAKPLKSFVAPFTPVQAGSGDPSPDNVRAISGFTGINAVRCGVNLWDEEWESGDIDGNGQNIPGTDFRSKNYIPVVPGMTFYLYYELPNGQTPGSNIRAFYYDRNKTYISNTWCGKQAYTVPANAYYMRFYGDSRFGGVNDHVSINFPSTDTEYHAYTGNSFPVAFPSGQTIYGGELDLVSGVLTVTMAAKTLTGDEGWSGLSDSVTIRGMAWDEVRTSGSVSTRVIACNWLKPAQNSGSSGMSAYTVRNTTEQRNLRVYVSETATDIDTFKGILAANPLVVVCPLAEPYTIQLDPVTIQTLIGSNTIWTDTNGDNTIKYLTKG